GAPCTIVLLLLYTLQCRARIEHTSTTWAQHIPGQLEYAEPCSVQKGGDRMLLIDPGLGREIEDVDAAQIAIRGVPHELLYRGRGGRIDRLPQDRKASDGFTH